jgi:16S rRNA (uracil1498-N3)-methyltransferase
MRRILVPAVHPGEIDLPSSQAHHVRDVLRLQPGEEIEVFDAAGAVAKAHIVDRTSKNVRVRVDHVTAANSHASSLTVAAGVPKGARADWMIEKLSELGVDRFIPLAAERSVVIPKGEGKSKRWTRLAQESAKQSGRIGVMRLDPLTEVSQLLQTFAAEPKAAWYLTTASAARSILEMTADIPFALTLLVGPEGGWTAREIAAFDAADIAGVRLTSTILRVETAAIAAAAIARIALTQRHPPATISPNTARNPS